MSRSEQTRCEPRQSLACCGQRREHQRDARKQARTIVGRSREAPHDPPGAQPRRPFCELGTRCHERVQLFVRGIPRSPPRLGLLFADHDRTAKLADGGGKGCRGPAAAHNRIQSIEVDGNGCPGSRSLPEERGDRGALFAVGGQRDATGQRPPPRHPERECVDEAHQFGRTEESFDALGRHVRSRGPVPARRRSTRPAARVPSPSCRGQ